MGNPLLKGLYAWTDKSRRSAVVLCGADEQDVAVPQIKLKADLWFVGSTILVAISLLGFGQILWNYYGAGQ
jgi:hypothetical protein